MIKIEQIVLALNYALMLEKMKKGIEANAQILHFLEKGESNDFDKFGKGIPDWKTLIDYYQKNREKIEHALQNGYRISFLTKGALKNLLKIKFDLQEGKDFFDKGHYIDDLHLTETDLNMLESIIARNWTIKRKSSGENKVQIVTIELTYKPANV
ncbi:hypothetical protein J9303_10795 [Bacillaceae bacterium Marseille-Q3522]|nr:hypothetical protein [Bacillaceae bacterium Marseille-Q3522]